MANEIDRKALAQKWVHSHEEDTDDEMVFRPASYAFPPARGRSEIELNSDGTYVERVPGPVDVPEERGGRWRLEHDAGGRLVTSGIGPDDRPAPGQGQWQLEDSDKLALEPAGPGARKTVMQILQVAPDKLVVKKR